MCAFLLSGLWAAPAHAQTVGAPMRMQVLPAYEMRAPTVAWDGNHYIIVFEGFPERQPELGDLYVARVDPTGALVGGDVAPLGLGGPSVPQLPDLAVHTSSRTAAVAYLGKVGPFSDVALTTFDPANPAAATTRRLSSGEDAELRPSIAAADDGFLTMWSTIALSGEQTISGQRFGPDGAPVDPAPEALRATSTQVENRPFVLGAGDRYWVAWDEADTEDFDGYLTTVLGQGAFRFRAPVRVVQGSGRQSGLTVAPLGEAHYLVWQDFIRTVPDAWGGRVQDDLQMDQGPHLVTQVGGRTNEPEVAGDANGALVVWQSLLDGRTRGTIRAGRIDTAGRRLEIEGFEVLFADENIFEPAVAKGPGDQYLVIGIEDGLVSRIVYTLVNAELVAVPDPPPDAGVVLPDGGTPRRDAGVVDAARPDAGVEPGPRDAGVRPEARDEGCRSVPGEAGALWLLVGAARVRRRLR